jgi:hypothetical protein
MWYFVGSTWLAWHGRTWMKPMILLVMVDMGYKRKTIQLYLKVYNAFKHFQVQMFKNLPIIKEKWIAFNHICSIWSMNVHFILVFLLFE